MSFIKKIITYFKNFPSVAVILTFCLVVIEVHLNLARYNTDNVFKWDVVGYYSYLPATFIDKDLKLSFITPQNEVKYNGTKYGYVDDTHGNHILKYPMGMSVLLAPFFLIAHFLAEPLGYTQDGFSTIYQLLIEFSGLFYLLFGLLFLRKLLLQFYSEKITAISLLLILFATNLFYYATVEPVMSHSYSFAVFSVFLFYAYEFHKKTTYKNALIAGFLFGLIVLIRPVNIFFILPFLLIHMNSFKAFRERLLFTKTHVSYFIVFAVASFLVVLPQLLYYKYVTGNYLVFSYGKERFFFNQPHVLEVLFGFRKGWLIYTPIMILVIYGIIQSVINKTQSIFKTSVLLLLPIHVYIVSSWWCWWYGGSFGQRPLVDIYPLLVFPLAELLSRIREFSKVKRQLTYVVLTFCLILNLFQTAQSKYNIIDYDGMTFKEYIQVFGSLDPKDIKPELLDKPDYEKAVAGR